MQLPFILFKYFEDDVQKLFSFREKGLSESGYANLLGCLKTICYERFSMSELVFMGFHSYLTAQLSEFINMLLKPKKEVMFLVCV